LTVVEVTKYLKPREAAEDLGVNVRTLARWENQGIIQAIKTPSGQRRYDVEVIYSKLLTQIANPVFVLSSIKSMLKNRI
jgi:DNA-binding transcriptional MerR regulator